MTVTKKRLFGPALLTNASATKYTTPSATLTEIRLLHVSNGTTSAATVTVSIGADAAGTRIIDAESIPPNSTREYWGPHYLAAAEILAAFSGTTGVVTLTVEGSEISVG